MNYCVRCPIGVAGLISPWNLPLYLLTFKIAPAIAAGNTVVCKPSEMTSVTAWMMAKLMNEAGRHLIASVFIGVSFVNLNFDLFIIKQKQNEHPAILTSHFVNIIQGCQKDFK